MHRGNFGAFRRSKSLSLASEASSSCAGSASPAEVSQVRRTEVPDRGAAAAGPSQSGGGSPAETCGPRAPGSEEVGAQRARSGLSQAARFAAPATLRLAPLESRALSTPSPAWVVTRPRPVTTAAQTNFFQQPLMVITVIEAAIYL